MKKLLKASIVIGTMLSILSVPTYSTDIKTPIHENFTEYKPDNLDAVTPRDIRSHPSNINATLEKMIGQLRKLGK